MASSNKIRMGFRRFASLSTMALVLASTIAPSVASAQERGDRSGGRGEARGGQREFRGRGERMPDSQNPQQQTAPAQAQPAPQPQPAPPPQRQYQSNGNGQPRQAPPVRAAQQPQYSQRTDGGRPDWQRQGGQRPDRARAPGQQPNVQQPNVQQPNVQRPDWQRPSGQRPDGQRQGWRNQGDGNPGNWQQQRNADRNGVRDGVRDGRTEQWRNQRGDNVRSDGDRNRWQEGRGNSNNRDGWRGGNVSRNDRGDSRGWDRGWRSNNRYNWSSYRASNRGIYRPGRYYSPYDSYSYRRLGIGYTLGSLFYGQNYWINDPWSYRLPEAYDGYRWVRYYNDVMLVDTYSGEVVDVIYDFFW